MYDFIDVNETSEGVILPSEALKINGEYIENMIVGYRTLSVKGREALSPDVETYTTGIRDGSKIKKRRYPERYITVKYQLVAKSNEAFREAYNRLGKILNVEDAELIFNDEQDKYFTGTPCIIDEVEPGTNAVIGQFEIVCTDPFKYSIVEHEAEAASDGTVLIDYQGTYKSFPKLEAKFYEEEDSDGETENTLTGKGECGYIAFFNEKEKIIQLGKVDEADGDEAGYAKSQTLTNQTFKTDTAWGTTAKKLWAVNAGNIPNAVTQVGSVGMVKEKNPPGSTGTSSEDTTGGALSKNILEVSSTASTPTIKYKVVANTSNRTDNSVKVTFAVTGSLGSSGSYFLTGYGLTAHIYVGGQWHTATLKSTSAEWRGQTAHTVNISATVTGITKTTEKLTGVKFKVSRIDTKGTAGTLNETACADVPLIEYGAEENSGDVTDPGTHYMTATSYGTATGWHGPTITRTLSADANGELGATNFTLTYSQRMSIGDTDGASSQKGSFQIHLTDANGKNVVGVRIRKHAVGRNGTLILYINGSVIYETPIDLSYANQYFGTSVAPASVQSAKRTAQNNLNDAQSNWAYWKAERMDASIEYDKAAELFRKAAKELAEYVFLHPNDKISDTFVTLYLKVEGLKERKDAAEEVLRYARAQEAIANAQVVAYKGDLAEANRKMQAAGVSTVARTSTITKSGDTVIFNIGGSIHTFTSSAIANVAVRKITVMFEQHSAQTPLAFNGISAVKFVKHNCETWKDIPNKFSANDTVEADCKSGAIRLNGLLSPDLGALGNDWETFCLQPGLNQIGFAYSDWCEYTPTVKVRYREVFL